MFGAEFGRKNLTLKEKLFIFFKRFYSSAHKLSPRMDGISVSQLSNLGASYLEVLIAFFHHFWDILEDDKLVSFNEFHENGVVAGELGASFIAFTPKGNGVLFQSRISLP